MKRMMSLIAVGTVAAGLNVAIHQNPASAAAGTPAPVAYQSSGYGTLVSSSIANLQSGATAYSAISCTTQSNKTTSNQIASVNLGSVGKTGAVYSQSRSILDSKGRTSQGIGQVAGVNLLGGLVTADSVKSKTSATYTPSKTSYGSNSTTFVGIKVAGKGFPGGVGPNSRVALNLGGKPFASVVLNQQSKTTVNGLTSASTIAIHITVSAKNSLNLPIGTDVRIGVSTAAIKATPAGFAGASGYSLRANLASAVKVGPLVAVGPACTGGTATASLASASIPGLLSVGVTKTTATTVTTPKPSGSVTNTVAGLNVLAGLVSAQTITTSASASRTSFTAPASVSGGAKFVGLKVSGNPTITDSVAPNTSVTVANLGKVTLNKVTKNALGIQVIAVEVVLSKALGSLAQGTVVDIGVVNARVFSA